MYVAPRVDRRARPADGWFESGCELPLAYLRRLRRGYDPARSPNLMMVPREPNFFGNFTGQSHSGPWPYLQNVPLVFYGPGFIRERGSISLPREVTLADLAPTLAELVGVQPPNDVGRPLDAVLVPRDQRPEPPALIMTVVWDGGGDNVLSAWPDAWPELRALIRGGTGVSNATVGSSPSVTPAVHATIGTGAFPRQHGIVGIYQRVGGEIVHAIPDGVPEDMKVPTLADVYDVARDNEPDIGIFAFLTWHLPMMSQGALFPGGDKDIADIVGPKERPIFDRRVYSLPEYMMNVSGLARAVRRVDVADGEADGRWMESSLADVERRRDSPAWILHQTKHIKTLLAREGFGQDDVPDLFFTNYKQLDRVGHIWNMLLPEMEPALEYTDAQLEVLTEFLDRTVGEGRWVMVVTADHGQGPLAKMAHAWPIRNAEMADDIAAHLDVDVASLLEAKTPTGYYFRRPFLDAMGISLESLADYLIEYRLNDNLHPDETPPAQYRSRLDEPLLAAAFPSRELPRIMACARAR